MHRPGINSLGGGAEVPVQGAASQHRINDPEAIERPPQGRGDRRILGDCIMGKMRALRFLASMAAVAPERCGGTTMPNRRTVLSRAAATPVLLPCLFLVNGASLGPSVESVFEEAV